MSGGYAGSSAPASITKELRNKYAAAGQDHVFKYADGGKLSAEQMTSLAVQLEKLDLDRIAKLHKAAMEFDKHGQEGQGKLEPLDSYDVLADAPAASRELWQSTGLKAIAEGQVAACVLSGGAGTRLGFPFPKGMFDPGLPSGKSLFQLFAERLLKLTHLAGAKTVIPLYIMTSEGENDEFTRAYFEENKYFGYNPTDITFFPQGTLPCLTEDGKLMLETGYAVGNAADGNGGIYGALRSSGSLASMEACGVKYVHVFSVDNAIGKVADPMFIGYCISRGADVGNKVVWKAEPGEKVGVIGKRGGSYSVIEYSEMSKEDCEKTDSAGKLLYGAGNICNHFYTTDFLKSVTDDALIFHVAHKKIKTPSDDGQKAVTPDVNNGIKLECFIFDCFGLANKMAVLEGPRDEEFTPVKNPAGNPVDSPDSCRAMMTAQSKKWLKAAGVAITEGSAQVEIGPFVSYRGEGLEGLKAQLGDTPIDCRRDVYIDVLHPGSAAPRSVTLSSQNKSFMSNRWRAGF